MPASSFQADAPERLYVASVTRTDSFSLGFIFACALAVGLALDETKALLPGGAMFGLVGNH